MIISYNLFIEFFQLSPLNFRNKLNKKSTDKCCNQRYHNFMRKLDHKTLKLKLRGRFPVKHYECKNQE